MGENPQGNFFFQPSHHHQSLREQIFSSDSWRGKFITITFVRGTASWATILTGKEGDAHWKTADFHPLHSELSEVEAQVNCALHTMPSRQKHLAFLRPICTVFLTFQPVHALKSLNKYSVSILYYFCEKVSHSTSYTILQEITMLLQYVKIGVMSRY